jgi:hypothetical protein
MCNLCYADGNGSTPNPTFGGWSFSRSTPFSIKIAQPGAPAPSVGFHVKSRLIALSTVAPPSVRVCVGPELTCCVHTALQNFVKLDNGRSAKLEVQQRI